MSSPSRTTQRGPSAGSPLAGGIGLLLFLAAFFVLPLCAALAICSMPCCEHGGQNAGASLVSAAVMACETECELRSEEAVRASSPSVAPEKSSEKQPVTVADLSAPPARPPVETPRALLSDGVPHHADAPLHVLNSVFRI